MPKKQSGQSQKKAKEKDVDEHIRVLYVSTNILSFHILGRFFYDRKKTTVKRDACGCSWTLRFSPP